ncbi:hypothetical protein E2C01_027840 [Portunus trituberculatus]|uniref:Uncharacterized protein n=1 Tax=Portunus trituberculatus TaxID=210409 RepID=A0A5B7EM93_PORTR|nr:hypothetical protein [Portunus trituberculatus]
MLDIPVYIWRYGDNVERAVVLHEVMRYVLTSKSLPGCRKLQVPLGAGAQEKAELRTTRRSSQLA